MDFLTNDAANPHGRILLAHGAGAPMDTTFMNAFAERLCELGFDVARFEFAYMASRRQDGKRRPPPRAERLVDEYRAAIRALGVRAPLVIGGKSLGGRVASLMAHEQFEAGRIAGLVCLGYPFHPPGKPENLRTTHLRNSSVPTLLVQGERDPFGGADEVVAYKLPGSLTLHWIADGDHDLKPRKASGRTAEQNWAEGAAAIAEWAAELGST